MLYSSITYALDVIKTNRILENPLVERASANIADELGSLHDVGRFRDGLYRGFIPFIAHTHMRNAFLGGFVASSGAEGIGGLGMALGNGALVTAIVNPASVLCVRR